MVLSPMQDVVRVLWDWSGWGEDGNCGGVSRIVSMELVIQWPVQLQPVFLMGFLLPKANVDGMMLNVEV
jgi:hypothetical protein